MHSVEEIATKKGVSMAQIAVAWILSKPGVVAPVIGATKLSNLEDTIGTSLFSAPNSALRLNNCVCLSSGFECEVDR